MPTKIALIGEGGQGVQTIAKIVSFAAQKSGKFASYLPSFGVEQRGGVSIAYIQISSHKIVYPKFTKADILAVFSNRSVEASKEFISQNTLYIYDSSTIENRFLEKVKNEVKNYLAIPALKIASEKYTSKVFNVVIMGGLAVHLKEINYSEIENSILKELASKIAKKPEIRDLNLGALKEGLTLAEKFDQQKTEFKGSEPKNIQRTFEREGISWTRFPEYCKGCGLCIVKCPTKAITFSKDVGFMGNPLPIVDMNKCLGCGPCVKICPDGAIRVEKK